TPRPEVPRPELRAAVLARSRGGRRRPRWAVSPLAAAAVLLVVVGAGWAGVSLQRLGGRVRALETRLAAAQDTMRLLRGPGTRVVQVPVRTAGRLGSVTLFADTVAGRWYVACENLAANRPDEAYPLWFSSAPSSPSTNSPSVSAYTSFFLVSRSCTVTREPNPTRSRGMSFSDTSDSLPRRSRRCERREVKNCWRSSAALNSEFSRKSPWARAFSISLGRTKFSS